MPTKRVTCTIAAVAVVAICSIVMCLVAIPFVLFMREQSRQTDCANRLREHAVACHMFHDSYKQLPPGTLGHTPAIDFYADWTVSVSEYYWARAQQTSFLGLIMPFMEMSKVQDYWDPAAHNMYKYLDEFDNRASWFGDLEGAATIAFHRPNKVVCPNDNINDAYVQVVGAVQPVIVGSPETDAFGLLYWPNNDYSSNFGRTNYLGCAGAFSGGRHPEPNIDGDRDRRPYVGVMTSRGRRTLETIRDGTPNTLMLGESVGQINDGVRTRVQAWCYGGLARGRGGIKWDTDPAVASGSNGQSLTMIGDAQNASVVGFGSMHWAGANFARADCSTVLLNRSIDWQVFYSLCGSNDGEQVMDF